MHTLIQPMHTSCLSAISPVTALKPRCIPGRDIVTMMGKICKVDQNNNQNNKDHALAIDVDGDDVDVDGVHLLPL